MQANDFSALPIREKIGQLFFIGVQGSELNTEVQQLLEEINPGGVCFFARNIRQAAQTRKFIDDIKTVSKTVPFFSIDQEGGLVDRLRRLVTPMPAPSKLTGSLQVKTSARITASLLKILGFNMNFAPVVDVIDEKRAKFSNGLYSRTFGNSKSEVVDFSKIYLQELQAHGIIGCLKHFPGLGATEVDSHEELPVVKLTDDELFSIDLFPYRQLFAAENICAVMVAHAAFPFSNLQEHDQNGKLLPSSLSSNFINGLLRSRLGFENLVVTDDLEMGAIVKNYGIGEACTKAFSAGEDMLTICADPRAVREGFAAMLAAFESGKISEDRLNKSLERISLVKDRISDEVSFSESEIKRLSDEIADLNGSIG